MITIITEISKYLMMILFACYTYESFSALQRSGSPKRVQPILRRQLMFLFLIHLDAYLVIFAATGEVQMLGFYAMQVLLICAIQLIYRFLYKKAARLVTNHMCMLLVIGFIVLTRLDEAKAMRQFTLAVAATVITLLVPFFIRHIHFLHKLPYLYAGIGIALLALVAVAGKTDYGAKLAFKFGSVSLQPSELIKILFVFFVASMFYHSIEFKQVVITTVLAAAHVIILVLSKDLGSASIFFITYLVMLYVSTRKVIYALAGVAAGSVAAVGAYHLFSHIRARVEIWQNPFADYSGSGYQVAQSLFAMAAGGWLGTGIMNGTPDSIPLVEMDFMISAITEELGGLFSICVILVCMSCYIMFVNIAMRLSNRFYRLVALGLGTMYAVQVFLTVGGAMKFIPMTGVTLPLVSYGGSSMLSTVMMFAIIQGLYILREDEEEQIERFREEREWQMGQGRYYR